MKKEGDIDWSILRGSIILFCLSLLISGALIGGSYYFRTDLNKQYLQNSGKFKLISRRYLDVDQEEKLLNEYYPKFVELYNSGIIGREQRLNWLEALRKTGESIKLPLLTYEISSQQEFKPSFSIKYSGYSLFSSTMRLNLGLLHEGDLFSIFNDLTDNTQGIFSVTECKFKPAANEVNITTDKANISVLCLLQWFTINLPGGRNIELI